MGNQEQATELNQLSRLLFDKAAARWQWSLALGLCAGLIGLVVSLLAPSVLASAAAAGAAAVVLLVGYFMRFSFESIYDAAETMRRQSVLSEGLDWPITRAQFNEWRQRAGSKLLSTVTTNPRPADYYETALPAGPKRLAEMTFESVFWTKNLYRKMQDYLIAALVVTLVVLACLLFISPLLSLAEPARVLLVYSVYLIIPVLVSLDLFGLLVRLQRGVSGFARIESHLEQLAGQNPPELGEVLRLVAEYNCLVAAGLPIPKWVFDRHHDEIQSCWS